MPVAIAALAGVLLAVLVSFGIVQAVNSGQGSPVLKPLYNYGTR